MNKHFRIQFLLRKYRSVLSFFRSSEKQSFYFRTRLFHSLLFLEKRWTQFILEKILSWLRHKYTNDVDCFRRSLEIEFSKTISDTIFSKKHHGRSQIDTSSTHIYWRWGISRQNRWFRWSYRTSYSSTWWFKSYVIFKVFWKLLMNYLCCSLDRYPITETRVQ